MKKNGKVEVLRFLFCICIIFYHTGRILEIPFQMDIGDISVNFFAHGSIGVEFFFLVSGYFMAARAFKRQAEGSCDLGRETFDFMKHKFWGIFPFHLVAFIILFILSAVMGRWGVIEFVDCLIKSIPSLLFIQKFGYNFYNLNSVEWYISAMFIALLVLYPLCRRFYSMFVMVIAPFLGLYLSGMLLFKYDSMTGASRWVNGMGFACVLRAFAIISLGACVFEMARHLKEKEFGMNARAALTAAEVVGYVLVFIYAVREMPMYYEGCCVLILVGCLTLTFGGQTFGFSLFNRGWAYFLGKASLPLYLNQLAAIKIIRKYGRHFSLKLQIVMILLLAFLFSAVTYAVGRKILSAGRPADGTEKK